MIIGYILFSVGLLLSIALVLKPTIFTALNIKYYKAVAKLLGYDLELKPISSGGPEKIAKAWGLVNILFFLFMIALLYFTTKR